MDKKLLRCKKCNEVINLTEYDSSPEFEYDEKKQEIFERQMDDRQSFYLRHDGHELEGFVIRQEAQVSILEFSKGFREDPEESIQPADR